MANGRCRMHGGTQKRGIASPNFKHGRYTDLPASLRAGYERALADPELLNLTEEIALYQARVRELIGTLSARGSGARWRDLMTAWAKVQEARRSGDVAALGQGLVAVDLLLTNADGDYRTWDELDRATARLQSLVMAEQARAVKMRALVSTEEAMAFARALLYAVQVRVTDRDILAAIQRDAYDVMARGTAPAR